MTTYNFDTRKASLLAGISLLIMTFAAFFSYGYVHSDLITISDGLKTFQKIGQNQELFTMGIISWLLIIITDLLVSWGFYVVFYKTNRKISFLAMTLRLLYTIFLCVAVYHLFVSRQLVADNMQNPEFDTRILMLHIKNFDYIWSLGLIIFGLHLFLSGYLAFMTKPVPKVIALFLVLAGISYTLVHMVNNFTDAVILKNTLESVLMLPMFIGELSFGIWLLIKGGKKSTHLSDD